MLERIVPRLKIANELKLDDRHLVVQGTRHEYEIDLGSGACSRSGRHICIVPSALPKAKRFGCRERFTALGGESRGAGQRQASSHKPC